MDRLLLLLSTACFLLGVGRMVLALRAQRYHPSGFSFFANLAGFVFQTGFLYLRGEQLGRCPLTNLFEVLVFLCWSMVLFYLLIGPAYRLSLLGAFTSPLVFVLQSVALCLPGTAPALRGPPAALWLEVHAALTVLACGAWALACVAGAMYLAQERQLKTHHLHSFFYRLPPIHDLAVANGRLLLLGFLLYCGGLMAGMWQGSAHVPALQVLSVGIGVLYGAVLVAIFGHRISPRHVAVLSVSAFSIMLFTLWAMQLSPAVRAS